MLWKIKLFNHCDSLVGGGVMRVIAQEGEDGERGIVSQHFRDLSPAEKVARKK